MVAPRGLSSARFSGKSQIDGAEVIRPCRLASMAWPIADSWGEVPSPRLLADPGPGLWTLALAGPCVAAGGLLLRRR